MGYYIPVGNLLPRHMKQEWFPRAVEWLALKLFYRYRITITLPRGTSVTAVWHWLEENMNPDDWHFSWDGMDTQTVTFYFRKPKQLVYFALRWQ